MIILKNFNNLNKITLQKLLTLIIKLTFKSYFNFVIANKF